MATRIGIVSNTADLGVMAVRNLLVKLLRARYKDARLVLMAETEILDRVRAFHQAVSWIDEFVGIESERAPGMLQKLALWRRLRGQNLHMLVLSPESKLPYVIPYLCGIPIRVGCTTRAAQGRYLTHPVELGTAAVDRDIHWSTILAGYVRALGLDEFAGVAAHVPFLRLTGGAPSDIPMRTRRVVVHVGGNPDWNRRWPLSRFLAICERLAARADIAIVLIGSRGEAPENRALVDEVKAKYPQAAIVERSGMAIEATASVIAGADLFIGNDSGPMNIAVALGTPIVAIRGADADNFRPDTVDPSHIVFSNWKECSRYQKGSNDCERGCPVAYDRVRQDYPKCMESIALESVWRAVELRLGESKPREKARVI